MTGRPRYHPGMYHACHVCWEVQEFDAQLKKMLDGDMTLVSELGQLKLALEAAIKSAFHTPEVIRMFAKREPAALRLRLARLQEDHKLGKLSLAAFKSQAVEVIVALKKLGEEVRETALPLGLQWTRVIRRASAAHTGRTAFPGNEYGCSKAIRSGRQSHWRSGCHVFGCESIRW